MSGWLNSPLTDIWSRSRVETDLNYTPSLPLYVDIYKMEKTVSHSEVVRKSLSMYSLRQKFLSNHNSAVTDTTTCWFNKITCNSYACRFKHVAFAVYGYGSFAFSKKKLNLLHEAWLKSKLIPYTVVFCSHNQFNAVLHNQLASDYFSTCKDRSLDRKKIKP